jgi:uncharacterized protein (TIGR03118 family)
MFRRWKLAAVGASALTLLIATPAAGSPSVPHPERPTFKQVNQVSDQPMVAAVTDPDLVNSWGLALSATGPLWVANNGTNTATIYSGGVGGAPVTKSGLTVTIDGDAPTGEVFNDTPDFTLPLAGSTQRVPAVFIFDGEGGDIDAWNPTATGTTAIVVAHVDGAVFKGLAIWHTRLGNFLLATDFAHGVIWVFDRNFNATTLPGPFFQDRALPPGYAPFNVMTIGETVYVSYAKQVPGSEDEAHGHGLGIVDRYTDLGVTRKRIASHGPLNAPWGMAIAPDSWGTFAGALLVGNFGDGRINVYKDGFVDQLRDANRQRITIDGLWALLPGTANTGGTNAVWFSSGPNDENDGLVGELYPNS